MPRQIIREQAELEEFCMSLVDDNEVQHIACDVETEELSKTKRLPWELELYGVGICGSRKYQAYIVKSDKITDWSVVDSLLHSRPVVFHNAKFDVPVLETAGILSQTSDVDLHDTMLLSYVQDENRFSHGLKQLSQSLLKVKDEDLVKYGDIGSKPQFDLNLFSETSEEKATQEKTLTDWEERMGNYCMDDCYNTHRLYTKFISKLNEEDPSLIAVYEKIEIPFLRILMDMERRGITLDLEYLKTLEAEIDSRLVDLGAEIYKEAGREFNIASTQQLGEILFTEKGYALPNDYKTSKGALSTGVSALEYLRDKQDCKLAELILKYRELAKLQNTYIQSMPKLTVDGVLHCHWNQIGTVTGRISSSNPNLQNIPRRDDEFNIRKAFVPRKGYKFVIADYSQVELRIMAYYSSDPKLIQTYKEGGDIHKATADAMGCERFVAKTINFGLNYGRTAYGMSHGLGISPEQAQKFIDKYFEEFPLVREFMQKANNTVKSQKFVQTLTRRRRRFKDYNSLPIKKGVDVKTLPKSELTALHRQREINNKSMERQSTNAIIQGSAADIMKIAMRNMHDKLKEYDSHILLQIHDEVVVEVPEQYVDKVLTLVKDEMENAVKLGEVPLVSDPKITTVWEK